MINQTDYKHMLKNPEQFFNQPGTVVDNTELERTQKFEILQSWQNIEEELQVATSENMSSGEADKLNEVNRAINRLQQS